MPTRRPIIKPSRTRAIGPREAAFMRGEPVGEFCPAPMYLDTLGDELVYLGQTRRSQPLPFEPDPQHSCNVGSTRDAPVMACNWGLLLGVLLGAGLWVGMARVVIWVAGY